MTEPKDSAIKLFGKTIPLPEIPPYFTVDDAINRDSQDRPSCTNSSTEKDKNIDGEEGGVVNKDAIEEKPSDTKLEDGAPSVASDESRYPDTTLQMDENSKTHPGEKESATSKTLMIEEEQSEKSTSPENTTLKKPDKILPCPRCNSMDTKFCYYNNYNVSQPRHFCKNCQRYWTAGGTMRNVPVGAGRRKNKNSVSLFRQIADSEALQNARKEVPNGVHPSLRSNGTVLAFGSDTPLCESIMPSVLKIADKSMRHCTQTGFHRPDELMIPISYGGRENGDSCSNGSYVTASNSKNGAGNTRSQEQALQKCQAFPQQIPCFPGAPWPYPWNPALWSPPMPPPALCPPGFPMPFYPATPYWGCTVPGSWNIPWLHQPSSPKQTASNFGPDPPTLGKHSRDENTVKASTTGEEENPKDNNSERCLWVPKTLRIDDPGEAAKSSIWMTLGIKYDKADSLGGGGLFKSFQSKGDEKSHSTEFSPVLHANPAALSRSQNFHETS
ncbi:hypothetical protein HS088_TW23G00094 [Tripterygium wilfordii]|uniref:Dof-type domain-containing protein n=1 Tax=Tripterygium wilfordii TaxID=458696 RepID=A0A7J7BTN3_TRIWF|nr:cyclic dof factor 3-like [Tripterygium wilfordii]KAF5725373.1 hypothetical protein HS088_TW23G00094 [Tripterygium wilfordii]